MTEGNSSACLNICEMWAKKQSKFELPFLKKWQIWVRGTTHETPLWSKHFGIIFQATTTEALTTNWPAIYYISNKVTQRKLFQTRTAGHLTQPKQCFNYCFATKHTRDFCKPCPDSYFCISAYMWLFFCFFHQLSKASSHHKVLLFPLSRWC